MHIAPGFPHQPSQPAPTPEHELKAMLKQLLQGQADGIVETSKKLADINSKIENLNTRVYSLENHASSAAAATKQGQLPENVAAEAPGVQNYEPEVQATQIAVHTSPVELAQHAQSAARSNPSRILSQSQKEVIHKFRRDLSKVGVELPFMESMSEAFEQMPLIQDVLNNKDKVSKLLEDSTSQTNILTSPSFLPKLEDQGKFTLPITLGHLELDNALVDSGASIYLISLTMAQKLGIHGTLQRPTTSIMFGDATSKSPLGVFKNYPLKLGECIVRTDLTVLEMEEEKDVPMILGTPFSSTVGASIDFHKQEVILHKVNSLVSYRLQPRGYEYCGTIESTPMSSKSLEVAKIVNRKIDKEPRVERETRVEKGSRLDKLKLEKPRPERPRADRLVHAPCVLDEESLQAFFDEPLGRALKEGGGMQLLRHYQVIRGKIHQFRPL
ncbi:unnamed protein product [Microthlaspi erraticum]|uniref:Aspartic peptidase DDI1-type domain-containing protein n=1 Tax=Microthlaspi erraticum TaxID=1685480 RepID=A0A6D2JVU7_9BRAS|nr:unnamed protein product [Microthlaspi erraticum]